jgi:hypothetical protein
MTKTETKFRVWAKKEYPNGFIKKIPDYKQLGNAGAVGLPDYVVIWKEQTIWWEVKSGFGNTLSLKSHFTDGQKITFIKMFMRGANIKIYCFTKSKGRQIIDFSKILKYGKIKFK